MTPLDILKAARAKIEKPECWGKGARSQRRVFDSCCAAEAIEETGLDNDWPIFAVRRKAYQFFRCAAGLDRKESIVNWNDAPERTHAEVLATYNLAIALARNLPRAQP